MTVRDPGDLTAPPDGRPEDDQPRWRRDFPIDWSQDDAVSRRDFTRFMVLTSFAFVVGQFWIVVQNLWRKQQGQLPIRQIVSVADLAVGESVIFHYPAADIPALLTRLKSDVFVAYDQQCTHLTCPVIPVPADGVLHCPCHEGYFDLETGRPLAGPPRRPLPRIILEVRDGKVFAVGKEESA